MLNHNPDGHFHFVQFFLEPNIAAQEGRAIWNDEDGTLNIGLKGGVVNLQVGQEMVLRGKNTSGITIDNGMAVRISGASGNKPEFGLSEADVPATAGSIGLATEDILNNANGYVTTFGLVRDIDTSGTPVSETWSAADRLYVSNTAGKLTNVAPSSTERIIFIGIVLMAHATEGIIWVNPINVSYVEELSGNDDGSGNPILGIDTTNKQVRARNDGAGIIAALNVMNLRAAENSTWTGIKFVMNNDDGEFSYFEILTRASDVTTDTEDSVTSFNAMKAGALIEVCRMGAAGLVVNELGLNQDTRIEGQSDTVLLYIRADSDRVGIGTNTPDTKLHVVGAITIDELSSDPTNPVEGSAVFWKGDGTGSGNDGDMLYMEQSGGVVETGNLKWTDFTPSSITLNAGSNTGGTPSDVQSMFSGGTYDIDEVAATPGYDVEFVFSGVDKFPTVVVAKWAYTGSATHFVTVDIWNYNSEDWDTVEQFNNGGGFFEGLSAYIPQANRDDYVSGGAAKVRFFHRSAGNPAHDISIDYVGLTHSLQGVI